MVVISEYCLSLNQWILRQKLFYNEIRWFTINKKQESTPFGENTFGKNDVNGK